MARRLRLSAWSALALTLAACALLAWPLPRAALDWQPGLAGAEPWRSLSAAAVHWSPRHLAVNLVGCAVLAWIGARARLPARAALAWALAWPATQLGLLWLAPGLAHYGGLSGVLHAGVAVLALELLLTRAGHERLIGALIAAGLALKLASEDPLGPALQAWPGWDIAIAPAAHLSGTLAGALCALLLVLVHKR
ncbi:rhombosortase [Roseateles sp. DAIF2]|uniref:rhombosortase n=1 Tax=Roseateles sp. DAIF2 TaxID=2714952 RepID=UPI0018A2621D|nr:rhombosortase [Roseateles sp. DAIF2]QPF75961.1 rhombosortase [Roseateles sp. DAIF2]